jgi:hypothetical protein
MATANSRDTARSGTANPAQRRSFIGNFLKDDWKPAEPFADNFEVVRFLSSVAKADLGEPIEGPSEEGNADIARMMAAEVVHAIKRRGVSASGWYTASLRKAFQIVALMHPELSDDEAAAALPNAGFANAADARTVLTAAMAITSQNIRVHENMQYALDQYRHFVEAGAFVPKGYGAMGLSVKNNLVRFNQVLAAFGGDIGKLSVLLKAEFTMGEFRAAAAKFGMSVGGRELIDEKVYGSMIFGPKIGGGFMQNLMGNYDPVTIDLWLMRTWGRYTGTLVSDTIVPDAVPRLVRGLRRSGRGKKMAALFETCGIPSADDIKTMSREDLMKTCRDVANAWERARRALVRAGKPNSEISEIKSRLEWPGAADSIIKSLGHPVDAPKSAGIRRWIRTVSAMALDHLKDSGYQITAADMQAILWYPEKELYDRLAGRPVGTLNVSYDQAAASIAKRNGISDELLEPILRSPDRGGSGRSGRDRADEQRDRGANHGLRERAPEHRDEPDDGRDEVLTPSMVA